MERPLLPSARAEAPPRFRRALALGCLVAACGLAASHALGGPSATSALASFRHRGSHHRHHATTTGSSTVASAAPSTPAGTASAGAQDVSSAVPAASGAAAGGGEIITVTLTNNYTSARPILEYPWAKLIVEPYRATTLRALRAADAEDSSRHTYRWTVKRATSAVEGAAAAAGAVAGSALLAVNGQSVVTMTAETVNALMEAQLLPMTVRLQLPPQRVGI